MTSTTCLTSKPEQEEYKSLVQAEESDLTELSSVSMKSDRSMDQPVVFAAEQGFTNPSLIQTEGLDSTELSSVSMKSGWSIEAPPTFTRRPGSTNQRTHESAAKSTKSNHGNHIESVFKTLEQEAITLLKNELTKLKSLILSDDPESCVQEQTKCSVKEEVLKITLHVLEKINQTALANTLRTKLYSKKYKNKLRDKYKCIYEGIPKQGTSSFLSEIYTELYITEGCTDEINLEHEVTRIEAASRRSTTQEKPIKFDDLFKDDSIRTILTKGVAGIGKTVLVQKLILDWAEGRSNQDVALMIPLPFRELNLIKHRKLSLVELLQHFFLEITEVLSTLGHGQKVIFILDGLDECRLSLNFNESLFNIMESAWVDVLLTNLIRGNLLPSAFIWITSRPGAANQIPPECVSLVTEVRGFNDPQKEEYFKKKIADPGLSSKIISHMKSSRSLYIMCHIPVFCWISVSVLERMLGEAQNVGIPKTLTQMFTYFLIFQIKHKNQKYQEYCDLDLQQIKESLLALGKLAYHQLEKGNLIFFEDDLRKCGIDVKEAAVYSGVCTQIFREEFQLHLGKSFSFIHLSVQEFLAAFYTLLSVLQKSGTKQATLLAGGFKKLEILDLLKFEVDKALQSESGHLDLYLRFLLGLSLESNQILLRDLLPQVEGSAHNREKIIKYIKMKLSDNLSPEKSINLLHCLNELNDQSLVQEVQTYLKSIDYKTPRYYKDQHDPSFSKIRLSPAQWSALAFVLLNSEDKLEDFHLGKYEQSDNGVLRLVPVIKASRKAVFSDCNLTEESCLVLSMVLSSSFNCLKELDLSLNKVGDSGVKLLVTGLQDIHCKLETVRLSGCNLTEESCGFLSSLLESNITQLRTLDMSYNRLHDAGVKLLSNGLHNPQCKLERLELSACHLADESCAVLSSVFISNSLCLRDLNISKNNLQDSGVCLLSAGLQNPHCNLEILRIYCCNLKDQSCGVLSSVLSSNMSSLVQLDLSYNKLYDSGVTLLTAGLKSPHCKLERLMLRGCNLTGDSCATLCPVLSLTSCRLMELELSYNKLQDSGVEVLCAALMDSHCNLNILGLEQCGITDEGFDALASALKTNGSLNLEQLYLFGNKPGESGIRLLTDLQKDPCCSLEHLYLFGFRSSGS